MKNDDSIESLITSTITHIVIALDNDKPGDAKVYAEALVLLKQAQTISSPNWTYSKPFEKISDPYKHNPNV